MSGQERILDVAGVRTHVVEGGDGEPLLYLHGAGSPGLWNEWQGFGREVMPRVRDAA